MKKCKKCGANILDDEAYCKICGFKQRDKFSTLSLILLISSIIAAIISLISINLVLIIIGLVISISVIVINKITKNKDLKNIIYCINLCVVVVEIIWLWFYLS